MNNYYVPRESYADIGIVCHGSATNNTMSVYDTYLSTTSSSITYTEYEDGYLMAYIDNILRKVYADEDMPDNVDSKELDEFLNGFNRKE